MSQRAIAPGDAAAGPVGESGPADAKHPATLSNSESRMTAVVNTAAQAVITIDHEGTIRFANPATERLFGYGRDELIGRNVNMLMPSPDRERHDGYLARYLRTGEAKVIGIGRDVIAQRKDGSTFPVRLSVGAFENGGGRFFSAIFEDISARRRAEDQIARQALEARLLHQATALAAETSSFEEALQSCVDIVCEMAGWPVGHVYLPAAAGAEQLLPADIWHLDQDERYAAFREVTARTPFARGIGLPGRIWESGEPAWIVNVQKDDNFPRAKLCSDVGVRGAFGFPIKIGSEIVAVLEFFNPDEMAADQQLLMVVRSVGEQVGRVMERRRAEEAIRKAHDELERRVAERTEELTYVNLELRQHVKEMTALNKLGRQVGASLSRQQVMQAAIEEVVDPVALDVALLFIREGDSLRLLGAGPTGSAFLRDQTPLHRLGECLCGLAVSQRQAIYSIDIFSDPRCTWEECKKAGLHSFVALPLFGRDQIIGVLGLASGTERDFGKQAAFLETLASAVAIGLQNAILYEQAEEHAAQLERRVAERTAELAAAKDQAESADRLKSSFLATMSHELRTPLNSIIGFTGIMLQGLAGPVSDEQTKQLGMVRDSARHLLNLINDVLDISKIDAGQLEIVSEPFDVRESIEKVVASVTLLAEQKGLAMHTRIPPELDQVVSDRRRVEQILLNLLNNAIKFTKEGEVRLECQVDDRWLVTRVADTGIGIKPEDMGKLFQPFRQVETGPSRQHEGTGLGLAICKKLTEMLDGEIGAESQWGAGSTFTLKLPA